MRLLQGSGATVCFEPLGALAGDCSMPTEISKF